MAIFGISKEWIFLFGGCAIAGLIFWVGIEGLGVKAVLMWSFIGFGFLTVILHACGSPIGGVVSTLLQAAVKDKETKPLFSEDELVARREKSLKRKQGLQNKKAERYVENVLKPREEALRKKKEKEMHRFTRWRDRGHKLGYGPEHLEEFEDNENFEEEQDLRHQMASGSENGYSEHNIPVDERRGREFQHSEKEGMALRQRTTKAGSSADTPTEMNPSHSHKNEKEEFSEEPPSGVSGVITIALRSPTGKMNKRRFSTSSQLQSLVEYAEWLGYPGSEYAILRTFPREPLPQLTLTFAEAGLTHDTAFVIEEI